LLKVEKENNRKIKIERLITLDFYIKSKVRNKEIVTIKVIISSKLDSDLEKDPFSDSEFLLIKSLLNQISTSENTKKYRRNTSITSLLV